MSRTLASLSTLATMMTGTAMADVPNVAVDIAPVHSLVAQVMDGVGTPDLVLPPGASPHAYNMRPSEAAALQNADVVIWMGEDLAPWMEGAVETLAEGAAVLTLLEAEETTLLEFRESALFEKHSHGDDDHDHDHGDEHAEEGHDHEEHADGEHDHDHDHDHEAHGDEDHAHDDHSEDDHAHVEHDDHAHDEHDDHAHDEHDGHAHGAFDSHAWLSTSNAAEWLNLIAAELSAADPENAGAYFANAATARASLDDLKSEVNSILDPVRGGSFVVFHDAYQYFETDFDFFAAGAISLSDATEPSPARIAEIQDRVRSENITCVLAEPQFNAGIVSTILDGTDANTGVSDPIGASLEPGPTLYPQLIRNLATTLSDCM